MAFVPINLAVRSNPSRHGHEGAARLINCYAEEIGEDGKAPWAVYPIDGFTQWGTVANGGDIRALLSLDSTLLVVSGRLVARFDTTGAGLVIGGIPSDGLVTMARNRRQPSPQVGIVCDGYYGIVENNTLTEVNDPDLPPPTSVAAMDGYFVLFAADGRFFITAVDQGATIDPLDFATAESDPDGGVRVAVRNRDLVLFGVRTTEFWQNTGAAGFPFARTTTAGLGCLAAGSVAEIEQTLAWIAHDGTVRALDGYQGTRISTHAVERSIASEAQPELIRSYAWQDRGHSLYTITGATGWTRTYDFATQRWHERKSNTLDRWRISAYARFDDKHIIGDYAAGTLYEMRNGLEDEAGQPIIMEMRTPPVHAFPHRLRFNSLFADVIPGVGLNSTSPELLNPAIMVDYSDDGGNHFGGQRALAVGAQGDRLRRVVTRRLGATRHGNGRTFRLSMSASVIRGMFGLSADVDKLAA